jgi:hypothetical protein
VRLQLESATDVFNLDDVLMKDQGIQATTGVAGLGLPQISTQWIEGAGDGALFRGRRVLPRDIDLPLYIVAPDREGLKKLVSRLALMLAGPCILRLVEDDGSSWSTEVHRVGGGGYVYGSDTIGERDLTLILTLRAGDPFWTYSQASRKVIENSGSGRGLLNGLAQMQVSSSQAIGSITLENLGDAPAYPVWEVTGPGSNFHARSADGQEFRWNGTLDVDEKLIIDTRTGTVKDGTGANRYAQMGPAPRLWSIPPGTTTAVATLENTSSGTLTTGDLLWRNLVTNPRGETTGGATVLRTNLMTNPRPRNYASSVNAPAGWRDTWAGGGTANFTSDANGVLKKTWTAAATSDHNVFAGPNITSPPIGVNLSARMKIRISATPNGMPTSGMALRFDFRDAGNVSLGTAVGDYVTWGALGEWMTVECRGAVAPAGTAHVRIIPLPNSSVWKPAVGTVLEMSEPQVEIGNQLGVFFDGAFTGNFTYAWTGAANASTSTQSMPAAKGQMASVSGEASHFPYWAEGSAGSRYQRWRAIAGTPATSYRVARSIALSRADIVAGQKYTLLARIRRSGWDPGSVGIRLSPGSGSPEVFTTVTVTNVGSSWVDVRHTFTALVNGDADAGIGLYVSLPNTPPTDQHGYFDLAHWAVIPGDYSGQYFDGDTADSLQQGLFGWAGVAHDSVSNNNLAKVTGRSSVVCSWRPRKWMVI